MEFDIQTLEGEVITLEKDILPDLKTSLAWLTSENYNPADNPDHELKQHDIDNLEAEILSEETYLLKIKSRIAKYQFWLWNLKRY